MSRYIDAEKCLKDNATLAIDWIDLLENEILTPTADVREVVRGEWVDPYDTGYYKCSICDQGSCRDIFDDADLTDFCPNCGADMRGEDNAE